MIHRTPLHRFLLALAMYCLSLGAAWPRPLEILFVGNSYTYVNALPEVFAQVAAGAGLDRPHVSMHAPGGQTIAGHCRDAELLRKLEQAYDVVILQEQSLLPAWAEGNPSLREQFLGSCEWLARRIRQRHPQTRVVLYQTWAREARCWEHPAELGDVGGDPAEMQARLSRSYTAAALRCRGVVAPVGETWLANYQAARPLRLHAEDGSHPSQAGTYLAALVLMATVYENPAVTSYTGAVTPEEARRLQVLAQSRLARPAVRPKK